jgi:hypothetical protein
LTQNSFIKGRQHAGAAGAAAAMVVVTGRQQRDQQQSGVEAGSSTAPVAAASAGGWAVLCTFSPVPQQRLSYLGYSPNAPGTPWLADSPPLSQLRVPYCTPHPSHTYSQSSHSCTSPTPIPCPLSHLLPLSSLLSVPVPPAPPPPPHQEERPASGLQGQLLPPRHKGLHDTGRRLCQGGRVGSGGGGGGGLGGGGVGGC